MEYRRWNIEKTERDQTIEGGSIPHSTFHIQHSNQKGFTLIEALVSTAIFALVVTSVLGVYMTTLQLDTRTKSQRLVLQNTRYIMEFLAKEIRNGSIDYTGTNNSTRLSLVNQLNEAEVVSLDSTNPSKPNLVLSKNGSSTNLNSGEVSVDNLVFNLQPATDPFNTGKNPDLQPHVTVAMILSANLTGRAQDTQTINIQTTFTVRNYPTREP